MKRIHHLAPGIVLLVLLCGSVAFAGGDNKAGTSAAPELLIPVGARDIAMGGASISTSLGIDAIYWNPAGLSRATERGSYAVFSHMSYLADMAVNYFAVSSTFGDFGTLGFSLKSLNVGDIHVTTDDFPDGTGEIITPTFVTLGATYSKLLAENISVGFTTNLVTERIDRVSATGVAFNAGVQYSNLGNVNGLSLGVVVKNVGPQMKYDGSGLINSVVIDGVVHDIKIDAGSFELPSTIEIGASYTRASGDNSITLTSMFQNNNFSLDEYKFGAEYSYQKMFFIRGGWDVAESRPVTTDYIYGPSGGVGLVYTLSDVQVAVDYAYRYTQFFDGNHVVTIRLGF